MKHYRRATEIKPYDEDAFVYLEGVQRRLGNVAAAQDAGLKVIEITSRKLEASLDDTIVMSRLSYAYAIFSSREEATETMKRVMYLEPNDGLALYNCACAYALLGDTQASFILLQRAFQSGFRAVAHWARTESAFDEIRGDGEFQRLVAELR